MSRSLGYDAGAWRPLQHHQQRHHQQQQQHYHSTYPPIPSSTPSIICGGGPAVDEIDGGRPGQGGDEDDCFSSQVYCAMQPQGGS